MALCAVCSQLSCVQLFVTPWTVAHQAPLSMDSPDKNTGVAPVVKNRPTNAGDTRDAGSTSGSGRSPGVFLPGDFRGQRSLPGYSPWGQKELDATEMT